jgi:tRNA threonylcarbamoyladenosine biosynthesis protein TsaB
MKLLAWDTSSKAGTVVAVEWNPPGIEARVVAELALNVDSTHSERLLWGIHQVLEAARWTLQEVDLFGVGVGPGSFTGLRIGITTARTLAHTLKKPLVGVSSLAALARPVGLLLNELDHSKTETLVVAATDACKGELFALWGKASEVKGYAISPRAGVHEQVISPDHLVSLLQSNLQNLGEGARWIVIGEGKNRYLDEWKRLDQNRRIPYEIPCADQVQGRYLGLLVLEAYQAGLAEDPLVVHPQYLRASDAEVKLKAGLLSRRK